MQTHNEKRHTVEVIEHKKCKTCPAGLPKLCCTLVAQTVPR